MYCPEKILQQILKIAQEDDRVLAVFMNGSRTNPAVEPDLYQDFDLVFVVEETLSFVRDSQWMQRFGPVIAQQQPDSPACGWQKDKDPSRRYTWLALYQPGYRIDLHVMVAQEALPVYLSDTLCQKLYDRDGILPPLPPPSDRGYWITPPTAEGYRACCNEFWWCLNNVAKALARDQLPYGLRMYLSVVHPQLDTMAEWTIAQAEDYAVNCGLWGKYFKKYLPEELYQLYLDSFPLGRTGDIWRAVDCACRLFRVLGQAVGARSGFVYDLAEDQNMRDYLQRVKAQSW